MERFISTIKGVIKRLKYLSGTVSSSPFVKIVIEEEEAAVVLCVCRALKSSAR